MDIMITLKVFDKDKLKYTLSLSVYNLQVSNKIQYEITENILSQ